MVKLGAGEEDRGLWRRWRARGGDAAPAPSALELAAYAERRLGESEAETVENWLAGNPAAWSEFEAARGAAQHENDRAGEALIARACGLVADLGALPADGKVVPLRRPPPRPWRNALAWSSIAASLIATSLVGFSMGSDAYRSLSRSQAGESAATDALEASSTLDIYFSDDSGT
jgi:hypothetical protein